MTKYEELRPCTYVDMSGTLINARFHKLVEKTDYSSDPMTCAVIELKNGTISIIPSCYCETKFQFTDHD